MVGNKPNYNEIDVFRIFLRIDGKAARAKLAKELSLGEGTVRTILDILKEKGIMSSTKKGHYLSLKGEAMRKKILEEVPTIQQIEYPDLYPDEKKCFALIRGAEISDYMRYRDIAVKNNANGALIFRYQNRLYIPREEKGNDLSSLEKKLRLKNGDILLMAFSGKYSDAERGAIAAAASLSKELKKFISMF